MPGQLSIRCGKMAQNFNPFRPFKEKGETIRRIDNQKWGDSRPGAMQFSSGPTPGESFSQGIPPPFIGKAAFRANWAQAGRQIPREAGKIRDRISEKLLTDAGFAKKRPAKGNES